MKKRKKPYKIIEGLTLADVAFEVTSSTLEGLFAYAGLAVTSIQIKNLTDIKAKVKKKIMVKADNVEGLLFKFLDELIFLKDKDNLLFTKFSDIKIKKIEKGKGHGYSFSCYAYGEKIDVKRHQQVIDVKAVTMHHFKVEQVGSKWKARVILDV